MPVLIDAWVQWQPGRLGQSLCSSCAALDGAARPLLAAPGASADGKCLPELQLGAEPKLHLLTKGSPLLALLSWAFHLICFYTTA